MIETKSVVSLKKKIAQKQRNIYNSNPMNKTKRKYFFFFQKRNNNRKKVSEHDKDEKKYMKQYLVVKT